MEYQSYERQNKKTLSQFIKSKFLKQVTKLVLSVSVFSLFFGHTTWLSFLHSFNFYSTLPIRLFSHTLDKNFIFLFCNGLLVFLAKYSGLFSSSSTSSSSSSKYNLNNEYYFKHYEAESRHERIVMESEAPLLEEETGELQTVDQIAEQKSEQVVKRETEELKHVEQEPAEETKVVILEDDQEETKEPESDFFTEEVDQEEEEEKEEQNGMLSTEELNKKFEDFIRKMKEELRIEARQQLVMV